MKVRVFFKPSVITQVGTLAQAEGELRGEMLWVDFPKSKYVPTGKLCVHVGSRTVIVPLEDAQPIQNGQKPQEKRA